MASWGSDGFENQIRQLKNQLGQKGKHCDAGTADAQLSTYMQEMSKKDDVLADHKRAKDDAVYKLQVEADALLKSEKLLRDRTAELQKAKLQIQNMESSIRSLKEKATGDEKEISRLQYELDSRSNTAASTSRIQEAHTSLLAKVKDLESQLRTAESDKETLRAEISVGHGLGGSRSSGDAHDRRRMIELERQIDDLKKDNSRLMTDARSYAISSSTESRLSPMRSRQPTFQSSPSPRHKRALSASSQNKVEVLEAQIDELQARLASSADNADSETLRRQYEVAKKESMKLTNQLMAAERLAKKEIEAMREKLDDAMLELEDRRRMDDGSGDARGEVEKLKKEIEKERTQLEGKIRSREEDNAKRLKEISDLQERIVHLQVALQQKDEDLKKAQQMVSAKSKQQDASAVSSALVQAEEEVSSLRLRISELELQAQDGTAASAASVRMGSSIEAQQRIRKLERELETVKRDKTRLEDEVDDFDRLIVEKDEEIKKLLHRVPLPESRATSAMGDRSSESPTNSDDQLAELASECDTLRSASSALQKQIYDQKQAIERLNMELNEAYETLEATKVELRDLRKTFELFKGEQEAFVTQRESFDADLMSVKTALAEKETQVEHLRTRLHATKDEKDTQDGRHKEGMAKLQELYSISEGTISTLRSQLEEHENLTQQVQTLTRDLAERSHTNGAVEAIIAEGTLLKSTVTTLGEELREAQLSEFGMKQDRDVAREAVERSRVIIETTMAKQVEAARALHEHIEASANEKNELQYELGALQRTKEELAQRIVELEVAEANRTSDTEAQHREEAAFDMKERVDVVQRELATKKIELDYITSEYTKLNADCANLTTEALDQREKFKQLKASLSAKEAELSTATHQIETLQASLADAEGRYQEKLNTMQSVLDASLPIGKALQRQLQATQSDNDEVHRLLNYAELENRFHLESSRTAETKLREVISAQQATETQLKAATSALGDALAMEKALAQASDRLRDMENDVAALRLDLLDASEQRDTGRQALEAAAHTIQSKSNEIEDLIRERNVLLDQAEAQGRPVDQLVTALQNEKRELKAKIGRREAQLAKEQSEARRLQMNLQLASASLREQEAFQNQLQEEASAASADNKILEGKFSQKESEMATLQAALNEVREECADKSRELAEVSASSHHLVLNLVQVLNHRRGLVTRIRNVHAQLSQTQVSRDKAIDEQNALSSSFASLQMDHQDLQAEICSQRDSQQAERMRHATALAELQRRLDECMKDLSAGEHARAQLESQQQALQSRVDSSESVLAELQTRLEQKDAHQQTIESDIANARLALQDAQAARTAAESNLAGSIAQIASLTANAQQLQLELSTARELVTRSETGMQQLGEQHDVEITALRTKLVTVSAAQEEIKTKLEADLADMERSKAEKIRLVLDESSAAMNKTHEEHTSRIKQLEQTLRDSQSDLQQSMSQLDQLRSSRADAGGTSTAVAADIQTLQSQIVETQRELENLRTKHDEISTRHAQSEAARSLLSSAKTAMESELRENVARIAELEAQVGEAQSSLQEADANEQGMIERLAEAQREGEEAVQSLAMAEMKVRELGTRVEELQRGRMELQRAQKNSELALGDSQVDCNKLQEELSDALRQIEILETARQTLQEQLSTALANTQQGSGSSPDVNDLKDEIQRLEDRCKYYMAQIDDINDDLTEERKKAASEKRRADKAVRKLNQMGSAPAAGLAAPQLSITSASVSPARPSAIFARPESAQGQNPTSEPRQELRKMASMDTGFGTPGRRTITDITDRQQARSPLPEWTTSSSAQKRGREEADKPGKVDAIVAPAPYDDQKPANPATPGKRRTSFGRAFTPSRSGGRPKKANEDQNLPPLPKTTAQILSGVDSTATSSGQKDLGKPRTLSAWREKLAMVGKQ